MSFRVRGELPLAGEPGLGEEACFQDSFRSSQPLPCGTQNRMVSLHLHLPGALAAPHFTAALEIRISSPPEASVPPCGTFLMSSGGQSQVVMLASQHSGGGRLQSEFKASLIYILSSKAARAT